MKISRHADGTYSITDMTRNDLSKLAFGACSDAAFVSQGFPGEDDKSREWAKIERKNADRLHEVLYTMERTAGASSMVVTSAKSYGDPDAFYVEKTHKVQGWRDNDGVPEDITSHLKRKGA